MVWFVLAGALTGADLGIKHYIKKNKTETDNEPILGGKVIVTKYINKGAALGLLKNQSQKLLGISLVCFGAIFGMLLAAERQKDNVLLKLGLSMLLGGAGSNVCERITEDGVTDYFKFDIGIDKLKNIVFNIGDFLILIGGTLTIFGLAKDRQ